MRRFPFKVATGLFAALAMAGLLTTAAPAFAVGAPHAQAGNGTDVTYSGDAYAVGLQNVKVLGSAVNNGDLLGDTGQLPAAGGTVQSPLGQVTLPGSLGTVDVTSGQVTGAAGQANASEKVAGLSLLDNLTGSVLCSAVGNLPLLGNALGGLINSGTINALTGGSSSGLGLLGGILGGGSSGGCGSTSSGSTSGNTSSSCLLNLCNILSTASRPAGRSALTTAAVVGGSGGLLGGVLNGLLGGGTGATNLSSLLADPLGSLINVGLVQSEAGAAAPGVSPASAVVNGQAVGTTYPYEDANVGTIALLGGALNVPINPAPNTVINLGILSITLNQQSYDAATNTASAQALVLNFPTNNLLSGVISGTITVSSSTADTSGTLSCPAGITVDGVSPTTGGVGGGTPVTVTGTNFASGATVAFGGTPASNVNVTSATTITATSPAHSAGTVTVSVDNCPNSPAMFTYKGAAATAGVQRFGGGNRIETAIAISKGAYPGTGSASAVVLSSDLDFQDGLAGVPLAASKHAPLLLTEPPKERNGINPRVLTEIQRVLTPHANKPVYLLGGTGVLAPAIATTLSGLGYNPILLAGPNAFSTAVAVANAQSNPSSVFLVTSLTFADALSAGPAAVHQGGIVLFTNGTSMDSTTAAYLKAHSGDSVFTVGGPAAAADPSATPIVGTDRFYTDTKVAAFFGNPAVIGIARGDLFPDALDGGTMVATDGGPIILVDPNAPLPAATDAYLKAEKPNIQTVNIYGGTGAVSDGVVSLINADLTT